MATLAESRSTPRTLDVWADPAQERLWTAANGVTAVRTLGALVLASIAAAESSLLLLVASLVCYAVGDVLDGAVARWLKCETRIGACLDILSDRLCAGAFYVGLIWLEPGLAPAVLVYLVQFMVVDALLSLVFLAWPLRSPNYFYAVDHKVWLWNWSKPGKVVNSSLFAVVLLVTGSVWAGLAIAVPLLVLKCVSLVHVVRRGIPIPEAR